MFIFWIFCLVLFVVWVLILPFLSLSVLWWAHPSCKCFGGDTNNGFASVCFHDDLSQMSYGLWVTQQRIPFFHHVTVCFLILQMSRAWTCPICFKVNESKCNVCRNLYVLIIRCELSFTLYRFTGRVISRGNTKIWKNNRVTWCPMKTDYLISTHWNVCSLHCIGLNYLRWLFYQEGTQTGCLRNHPAF